LPYYVLVSLLPAWLRTRGVSLAEIAAFSWLRFPYTWKFLWAPLLDRFSLPWLGRRRDWAVAAQVAICLTTALLGLFEPSQSLAGVAALCFLIAAFSASQDIAIDAYRRELLSDNELGLGNSLAVNAYRAAGLVPGGFALWLADRAQWHWVFPSVAAFMLLGVLGSVFGPEIRGAQAPPSDLKSAIVGPIKELLGRGDKRSLFGLFAFLFLYKLGDNLATALATPFYIDLGFTLTEIGTVVKVISLWSMVLGSLVGGVVMLRIGIARALWVFGFVQLVSIFGFALLAELGRDMTALALVVFFEYAGIGLGTAAFVAFIAQATNKRFTATQYALFSSFVALPGIAAGSFAGVIVEALGFRDFFLVCAVLGVPGLLLLPRVAPWSAPVTRA
jgi:PAT family beta-lactamase induction signal transducer AmpG